MTKIEEIWNRVRGDAIIAVSCIKNGMDCDATQSVSGYTLSGISVPIMQSVNERIQNFVFISVNSI